MRRKHDRTLKSIYSTPPLSNVKWKDIEALFVYLGAKVEEGRGSRLRIILNREEAVFHRPHPRKETDKGVSCPTPNKVKFRFSLQPGI